MPQPKLKYTSHVNFLVPEEWKKTVYEIAEREGINASYVWRRIVKNGLRLEGIKENL